MIDVRGAIDLHLHAAPSLFPRLATDREVAEAASQAGFAQGLFEKGVAEADIDVMIRRNPVRLLGL